MTPVRIEIRKGRELRPPRRAVRKRSDLTDLKGSIHKFGVLQPLVVNKRGEVVVGQRRSEAVAPNDDVPVIVRDDLDTEVKTLEARLSEEFTRLDWTDVARADAMLKLYELHRKDDPMFTRKHLARALGITDSQVDKSFDLASMPAPIKEHIEARRLSPSDAVVLNAIKDLEPKELVQLANKVASGVLPGGQKLWREVAPLVRETSRDERLSAAREQIIRSPKATLDQTRQYVERLKEKDRDDKADVTESVRLLALRIRDRVRYWRESTRSLRQLAPLLHDHEWREITRAYQDLAQEIEAVLALKHGAQAALPERAPQKSRILEVVKTIGGKYEVAEE